MTCQKRPKRRALWTGLKDGLKPNGTGKVRKPSPLKRRSSAYAKRMRLYRERVRLFLRRHPWCAICKRRRAIECHHWAGRMGKLLLEERLWIPVCRVPCHHNIHDHPALAEAAGLLAPKGVWNNHSEAVKAIKANETRDSQSRRL